MTRAELTLLRSFTKRNFTKQCGAYLALVALALQLALSFGHLHARDLSASGIPLAKAHDIDGWHSAASVEKQSSALPDDEDLCPVCFSAFLLSTSFVPDAPQPLPAFAFERIDRRFPNSIVLAATTRRGPFQSRAPPVA